jgi:hypothetical protein
MRMTSTPVPPAAPKFASFALLTLMCWLPSPAAALEPTADPASLMLEDLRAANAARAALASESAAWRSERERLQAVIDAVANDGERLDREVKEAERQLAELTAQLKQQGPGAEDIEPIRVALADAAEKIRLHLAALARSLPPGAVSVPAATVGDGAFDDAVRALEISERAATTVAIEIVPGTLAGKPAAVKALRVAGAACWWVAMDGQSAGTLAMKDGAAVLTPVADEAVRESILRAVAIVEGRRPAELLLLPTDPAAPAAAGAPGKAP